ncbi:MAG: VWA domain-containing protein [Halobacteriales archaeon]|nr:VWA domain-containing protein [Halobacteriales archaeon]
MQTARRGPASSEPRRIGLALAALVVLPALVPLLLLAPPAAALGGVYATCPQTTLIPRDVAIVFDRSASMLDLAAPNTTQTKFQAAVQAANLFLAQLNKTRDQSALVDFSTFFNLNRGLSFNHTGINSTAGAVNNLTADGATNLGGAVRLGRYELDNGLPSPAPNAPYSKKARANATHIMIVISDGDQTIYYADPSYEASYAKTYSNIVLYTVAVGTAISPAGLAIMNGMASDAQHAYWVPNATQLPLILQDIFSKLNDQYAPTVGAPAPLNVAHIFDNGVDRGPSPVPGMASIVGQKTVTTVASDDCLVQSVSWSADITQPSGAITAQALPDLGNVSLGGNLTRWSTRIDCDALPGGIHQLHVTATDFLGKTASQAAPFACIRGAVRASAQALLLRTVNPIVADAASRGVALPAPEGGSVGAKFLDWTLTAGGETLRLQGMQENANGGHTDNGAHPQHLSADARSIVGEVTLTGPIALDVRAFDGIAQASVSADPTAAMALVTDATSIVEAGPSEADAPQSEVWTTLCASGVLPLSQGGASISRCADVLTLDPGLTLFRDEQVVIQGLGFREVTVHALRVMVDRPELRAELILGEAYAGASWLGQARLHSASRALDFEDDAGLGADAPDAFANAAPIAPGTYGGQLVGQDKDFYLVAAKPGQKVHAVITPSSGASVTLLTAPPFPAPTQAGLQAFATSLPGSAAASPVALVLQGQLLDPQGAVRDTKVSATIGVPVTLELNVDEPGGWVLRLDGRDVNYTLTLTVVDVPMTHDDDALRGSDAGETCADAMLVGPGVQVGTLEYQDDSDWYRFQIQEGQILTLVLRPGDTVEAANMHLGLYGPDCQLVQSVQPLSNIVKGSPSTILFNVPTGKSGLWRAEVRHVNGIGTYELLVAPSVAAVP